MTCLQVLIIDMTNQPEPDPMVACILTEAFPIQAQGPKFGPTTSMATGHLCHPDHKHLHES